MSSPTIEQLLEMGIKGELPHYAWPGGYPIVYIDGWDNSLCPRCTNDALAKQCEDTFTEDLPNDWYIHYEGPSEFCYECNKEIESAYGNPWESE